MRQMLSTVLIIIAAVLVVGVKVVAPKPGSLRSDFTAVKTAVPSGMKSFPTSTVMSAIGTKRTCASAPHMSAFADKADMASAAQNIRFHVAR